MTVNGDNYKFFAERLKGGQRLLIPNDVTQFIIYSLLEQYCIEITVGRYEATLTFEGFSKTYDQLVTESFCPERLPIDLFRN